MTRGGASRLFLVVSRILLGAVAGLAIVGGMYGVPAPQRPTLEDGAPVAAGSTHVKVYVTPKGKTYHTHRDCIGLTRSKDVLVASEYDAQVQGITLCSICAHRHHAQTGKAGNRTWATPEAEAGK